MPAFVKEGFKSQELEQLNKMRLYLKVATLADLVQANGKDVIKEIWNGTEPSRRRPEIEWPKQGIVPRGHWNLWQRALTKCFGLSPNRKQSKYKLGQRIECNDQWEWYYHPNTERLYQRTPTDWIEWRHKPGRTSRQATKQFKDPETTNEVPTDLI
jgi:hypothetical protein